MDEYGLKLWRPLFQGSCSDSKSQASSVQLLTCIQRDQEMLLSLWSFPMEISSQEDPGAGPVWASLTVLRRKATVAWKVWRPKQRTPLPTSQFPAWGSSGYHYANDYPNFIPLTPITLLKGKQAVKCDALQLFYSAGQLSSWFLISNLLSGFLTSKVLTSTSLFLTQYVLV